MKEKGKMSKKKRNILIGILSTLVVIIVGILYYAFVVTTIGSWFLSRFTSDTEQQELSYSSAIETTEMIADEGFVLMQNNDNLLPLSTSENEKKPINLFGSRGVVTLFNSGGSTATDVTNAIKLEDALRGENGNFELNDELLYLNYHFFKSGDISIDETSAPANYSDSEILGDEQNLILSEVPVEAYSDESLYEDGTNLLENAKEFSDTAMIVLGRGGAEMRQLSPSQLRLTDDEAAMVDIVASNFEDVILILNSANVLQLDFLEEYPSIKSVLWIGYPGETGANSLARILNGSVNPSGRTVSTWPSDLMNNPAAMNYMELDENGDWISDGKYENAPEDQGYFLQLHEGIYVGYKYYETRQYTDENYNYDEEVIFPFGHGLSYSTFDKNILAYNVENNTATIRVEVENTGEVAGKDVIQLYSNPPYTGEIEKASANLVSFLKTNEIEPGETEVYTMEIELEDLASYDYQNHEAYVLEAGNYEIHLKNNSHDILDTAEFSVASTIVYNEENDGARATDHSSTVNQFNDAYHIDDYLTREWDQESRAFTGPQSSDYIAPDEVLAALDFDALPPTDQELNLTDEDMPAHSVELDEEILFTDMVGIEKDDPKWDEFISQLTLEELTEISGSGAYQLAGVERLEIPRTLNPDGTMAIASNIYSGPIMGIDGVGITYPSPMVLSSTWNHDLAQLMGTSVGLEAQGFGYNGWYAPAMNIHRTPFNGRNFEYYSEDAILSGKIAANVVQGATEQGVITYIKHFAVNERESGVRNSLFTWSNEQALREIYLKPFELAIKEGGSLGIMSSFNYIGLEWAGGSEALLNNVLRDEWGFDGFVITDAHMYPHMNLMKMLYNGGDVSLDAMASWQGGRNYANTLEEFAEDSDYQIATIQHLQRANKNVLYAVSETWQMQQD